MPSLSYNLKRTLGISSSPVNLRRPTGPRTRISWIGLMPFMQKYKLDSPFNQVILSLATCYKNALPSEARFIIARFPSKAERYQVFSIRNPIRTIYMIYIYKYDSDTNETFYLYIYILGLDYRNIIQIVCVSLIVGKYGWVIGHCKTMCFH